MYLDSNRLQLVEPGALFMIPKTLKKLSIAENEFAYGEYLHEIFSVTVQEVNISYMGMSHYLMDKEEPCDKYFSESSSCGKEQDRYGQNTSNIININTFEPHFDGLIPVVIPYQLRKLHYRHCNIRYNLPELTLSNNLLEYIDASFNTFYDWRGPIHNLKHLKFLDLSNNYCSNVSEIFILREEHF
ncbi:toll-like receptor 4 [Mytilus galloprovincialis]|uniref:toll-like receptor 4 n=1 Tax=Mytilus galloprovincialis TaxID=29158 RepID=UPI003F7BB7B1